MNSYYLINLLIYAAVDAMACLGLSQQFGVAGVTNFGFIIFQAAGGYTAAILALPSDSANGAFQSYLGGRLTFSTSRVKTSDRLNFLNQPFCGNSVGRIGRETCGAVCE